MTERTRRATEAVEAHYAFLDFYLHRCAVGGCWRHGSHAVRIEETMLRVDGVNVERWPTLHLWMVTSRTPCSERWPDPSRPGTNELGNLRGMAFPAQANLSSMSGVPGVTLRWQQAALEQHPFSTDASWRTDAAISEAATVFAAAGGQMKSRWKDRDGCSATAFDGDGWVALAVGWPGSWDVSVAAGDMAVADRLVEAVGLAAGPPPVFEGTGRVPLMVWTEHPMGGGHRRYSSATVGGWAEVASNYPGEIGERLSALAARLPSPKEGGLIVFAGKAGTGKTRAVEALVAEWSKDADVSLIVDPDRLLASASYLTDVMSHAGDRRHVVIVEDADELLATGPKSPAAARVLNMADGLLGRCAGTSGTLLVFTANLSMADGQVADYMTREGRAVAAFDFRPFTVEEATAWQASNRDVGRAFTAPVTLAELYAG